MIWWQKEWKCIVNPTRAGARIGKFHRRNAPFKETTKNDQPRRLSFYAMLYRPDITIPSSREYLGNTAFLRQQSLSDSAAIRCTQGSCRDSVGFYLARQTYSIIHLSFSNMRVAIVDTDALLRHRMAGGGGCWDFRASVLRSSIESRTFRSTMPVMARWWSTNFEREVGIEVRASTYAARWCDWSVWHDVVKADTFFDSYPVRERCQQSSLRSINVGSAGKRTSCDGGRARAPDWGHKTV